MRVAQIAVQCYTLRDHLQTAEDFVASMKRVRAIGYEAVQISGARPMSPPEIRRVMDAEGLTVCATHEPSQDIIERPEAVVEVLGTLGCTLTAYPSPHVPLDSRADVERLADGLNLAGSVLKAAGMVLTYHNHDLEFRKFGGQTVLEILFERTDPSLAQTELDTYWVQASGGDPVAWCERKGRSLTLDSPQGLRNGRARKGARHGRVRRGKSEFASHYRGAERGGCQWFIVEQDHGFGDPFVAIDTSFKFLSQQIGSYSGPSTAP